jgi:hypothetical protein
MLEYNRRINKIYAGTGKYGTIDYPVVARSLNEKLYFASRVLNQECEERFEVLKGIKK